MRKALAAGAIALALVAGGFGVRRALHGAAPAAAAAPPAAVPAVPVTLGVVKPANLPVFLRGIGTVQAYNTDTIRSRVDGEIVGVGFTEGQEVKAGTLLFRIDPRPYEASVAQAEAARAKDEGKRCDLEAGQAKLLGARVAWAAADNALQIHGGNGFALEYPVSRVLCDARILNIFEGAAEIQAQVIARRLLEA